MYLYYTCNDWAQMYSNTFNNTFSWSRIESVQTFDMSRAGQLMTTCDEVLPKMTAGLHYIKPSSSSNEIFSWRCCLAREITVENKVKSRAAWNSCCQGDSKNNDESQKWRPRLVEVQAAFSKVMNVSVPAALRTALLLFRPAVAQCASKKKKKKKIPTMINSFFPGLIPQHGKQIFEISPIETDYTDQLLSPHKLLL